MKVLMCVLLLALALLAFVAVRASHSAQTESDARAKAERELASARGELESLTLNANPRVRLKAVELLIEYKPEKAGDLCSGLLANEFDPETVIALLRVVGQKRMSAAFVAAHKQFNASQTMAVRAKAAWAIGEMAGGLTEAQRDEARQSLENTLSLRTKATTQDAKSFEPDPSLLLACADTLGKLKDERSSVALIALLEPQYPLVIRRAAVRCLDGIVTKRDSEGLQKAWKRESDQPLRGEIERLLAKEPFLLVLDRQKGTFTLRQP